MRKNYDGKSRVKVKRHLSNKTFVDRLSYSYSCIDAFKENQTLINNLINIKPVPKCDTVQEDPLLYSLSGERERPIYHPFYYSFTKSEYQTGQNCGSSESEDFHDRNILELENSGADLKDDNDSDNLYFDSNLFLQWIKYQFKYVNDLWPFLKSKDYFIPNLCKKSKEIKMEMLLNNIDEHSKSSLKKYVEVLQLRVEERCSIRNESVIEIDITPIMGDRQQLQEFLKFLQNIESRSNNPNQKPAQNIPKASLKSKMNTLTANYKGKGDFIGDDTYVYSSGQRNQGLKYKKNPTKFKQKVVIRDFGEREGSQDINFNLLKNSDFGFNTYTLKQDSKLQTRKESLLGVNGSPHNGFTTFTSSKTPAKPELTTFSSNKNEILEIEQLQTLETSNEGDEILEKSSSCKCLMHQRREDYIRYKNQCLFGKGDEKSNNFIGYVQLKEKESRLKLHKCLSNLSFIAKESINTPHQQKIYRKKYRQHENVDHEKSSGSNVTDVCFHNCQSVQADDSEEVIREVDFKDTILYNQVQPHPTYKPTANENSKNACFESLNYSFNSVSWTTISEPLSGSLTLSPGTNSSREYFTENLHSKIRIPSNKNEGTLKQPNYSFINSYKQTRCTGLKNPTDLDETFTNRKNTKQVYCVDIEKNKKDTTVIKSNENQSNLLNNSYKKENHKNFRKTSCEPREEIVFSEELKDFKRQTDKKLHFSNQSKKYSKLNVLKPKYLYKSISAMIKGNNTTNRRAQELTDHSTESHDTEFVEEQQKSQRASMTKLQQSEITALIIENFEKVYKELKQQNSEITNLKKILYDRIFED